MGQLQAPSDGLLVEFVDGSQLAQRIFVGYSGFPPPEKPTPPNSNSISIEEQGNHSLTVKSYLYAKSTGLSFCGWLTIWIEMIPPSFCYISNTAVIYLQGGHSTGQHGGALLQGSYNEQENAQSFAEALMAWRNSGKEEKVWTNPTDTKGK